MIRWVQFVRPLADGEDVYVDVERAFRHHYSPAATMATLATDPDNDSRCLGQIECPDEAFYADILAGMARFGLRDLSEAQALALAAHLSPPRTITGPAGERSIGAWAVDVDGRLSQPIT